jgi:flagellar basal-body rod protein FlgC
MDLNAIFQELRISGSGLAAERARMGLIARNIAQAQSTDRGDGTPYRRQEAVFSTVLEGELAGGVRVDAVVDDVRTPMTRVFRPSHPDADEEGMLTMPNVDPTTEMVDLIVAARSYEANLGVVRTFVQMAEQALELGRV